MELEYPQWYIPDAENERVLEQQKRWDCRGESKRLLTLWINEEGNAGKKDRKEAFERFRFYERELNGGERRPPQWDDGEADKEKCGFQREEEKGRGDSETNREEGKALERYEDGENEIGGGGVKEEEKEEEKRGATSKAGDKEEKEGPGEREEEEDDGGKDEARSMHKEKENEEHACSTGGEVEEEEEENGEREREEEECSVHEERWDNEQNTVNVEEKCKVWDGDREEKDGREKEEEFQGETDHGEFQEEREKQVGVEKEKEEERNAWEEGTQHSISEETQDAEEDPGTRGRQEDEEKDGNSRREGNKDREREKEEETKRNEEEFEEFSKNEKEKDEKEVDEKIEKEYAQKEKMCEEGEEEDDSSEEEDDEEEEDDDEEEECNGGVTGWFQCPECQKSPVLYCMDDLQPLCWACGISERHDGHKLCPPEQALRDSRVEVGVAMQPMFQSFKNLTKVQQTYKQMSEHIPRQSAKSEEQIHDQFEELRRFLRAEEEARIAAVRQEQERKAHALRERAERTREEMRKLLHALKSSHMEMEAQGEDGLHFLQNYKRTVKRVWKANQGPEKSYDSLIDVPKHVGNLRFRVWEKMKDICPSSSVTLDPNTASPFLLVSGDLTSVRDSGVDIDADGNVPDTGPTGRLPDNPERFACCGEMLGHEVITTSVPQRQSLRKRGLGFHRRFVEIDSDKDAGCTSWVVDVGDNNNWMLGVARRSVTRKSLLAACPENGCWALSLRQGQYEALESPAILLPLTPGDRVRKGGLAPGPKRVKVRVNHGSGRVCFTDADRHTHLYTFSHAAAATGETLQPYFSTACQRPSLKVLPSAVTVTISYPGPGGKDEEEEDEEEEEEEERQQERQMMNDSVSKHHRVSDFLIIPESQKHTSHADDVTNESTSRL